MGRYRYRHYYRWGPVRRRPVAPLLVLLLILVGAVVIVVTLVTLATFMLFGVAALVVVRHLHRSHRRAPDWRQPAPMPAARMAAPVARTPPGPDWAATRARFAQLRSEYAQFECDPLAVLRLPALTDVTVPATGRFVDAFAEAQALDTDTEPPPGHRARFATAVDQAWRAWQAAREAAER